MSTTFSVFPLTKNTPTFRDVLDLSTKKVNTFLKNYQINLEVELEVKLLSNENNSEHKFDLDSLAKWSDDFYAWFSISSVPGGADSYYWELNDEEKADNLEEFLSRDLDESRKKIVESCLENKIEWRFRRSAGQSCITTISYGFIASAFSELSNGFIWSEDGGWDYQIFPATAREFDEIYFRPERAISEEFRDWSKRCIENIG